MTNKGWYAIKPKQLTTQHLSVKKSITCKKKLDQPNQQWLSDINQYFSIIKLNQNDSHVGMSSNKPTVVPAEE